jgi:hypothetical protein
LSIDCPALLLVACGLRLVAVASRKLLAASYKPVLFISSIDEMKEAFALNHASGFICRIDCRALLLVACGLRLIAVASRKLLAASYMPALFISSMDEMK